MTAIATAIEQAGGPARCAKVLGGTTQKWCFYRDGMRKLPERYGAGLERLADGKVTRADMWPEDYRAIWPELADSKPNQPPTPAHQAQAAINSETEQGAAHA